MLVNEALKRLSFMIGTLDDIGDKALNKITNTRNVIFMLNTQLQEYANKTKGIQDVFSFPLETNTPFVEAPSLALRSKAYNYILVISNGTIFPADVRNQRDVFPRFRTNPALGITNWLMPWNEGNKQYLAMFPMNSVARQLTNLTNSIDKDSTEIKVEATQGFINNNGRITIDNEKILYGRKDPTTFYNCVRGMESTVATEHTTNDEVKENNIIIYYSRLPIPIVMTDDNFVDKTTSNRHIEVVEEHLEGILKATAYNVLIKLDPSRANIYKMDYDDLFEKYKKDIEKGYSRNKKGRGVRAPFLGNEGGLPYGANFMGY